MKVSIGIPVYNSAAWVAAAIESALNQTWPDKEVIVVDDGSTDRTPEVCAQYYEHVIYTRQEYAGANVARNRILDLASGDWIQYLDVGDYLLPEKVKTQLLSVPAESTPDLIFSPHRCEWWRDGVLVKEWCRRFTSPQDPLRTWLRLEFGHAAALLVRRSALLETGGWDESLAAGEVNELLLRLILHQRCFHYADAPLSVLRRGCGQPGYGRHPNRARLICASLIDSLQQELIDRGEWDDSLQDLADRQRFRLARLIAATDLPSAVACYLTPQERNLVRHRYATSSWRVRSMFYLFGFERAERVARVLRCQGRPWI